ncbi:MAG: enoyl-CoA hydratase/isomerase family protein [Desulfohalobiaceae bacterium]|nr:enoyl-CoA hydratase/isomerase family protein [Desulfohalobiaceae bacterium]
MSYENIIFEVQDNVGVLTINRPKVMNALNPETLEEIARVVGQVKDDDRVKVLVITGAGDKAFVAGADISQFQKQNALQARLFAEKGQDVFFALEALPIPVIACVNGFALGGGCELAMSCDFIYASEKAKFGQPEINLGIIPGFGGTQRLARLVGRARAKELCMVGAPITAQEAREIGLAARVFPAEELWDKTMDTARGLAAKGSVALRAIKQVVDRGLECDLKSGCAYEVEAFATSFCSEDAREGVAAFLEKRKPEFKGSFEN